MWRGRKNTSLFSLSFAPAMLTASDFTAHRCLHFVHEKLGRERETGRSLKRKLFYLDSYLFSSSFFCELFLFPSALHLNIPDTVFVFWKCGNFINITYYDKMFSNTYIKFVTLFRNVCPWKKSTVNFTTNFPSVKQVTCQYIFKYTYSSIFKIFDVKCCQYLTRLVCDSPPPEERVTVCAAIYSPLISPLINRLKKRPFRYPWKCQLNTGFIYQTSYIQLFNYIPGPKQTIQSESFKAVTWEVTECPFSTSLVYRRDTRQFK